MSMPRISVQRLTWAQDETEELYSSKATHCDTKPPASNYINWKKDEWKSLGESTIPAAKSSK